MKTKRNKYILGLGAVLGALCALVVLVGHPALKSDAALVSFMSVQTDLIHGMNQVNILLIHATPCQSEK